MEGLAKTALRYGMSVVVSVAPMIYLSGCSEKVQSTNLCPFHEDISKDVARIIAVERPSGKIDTYEKYAVNRRHYQLWDKTKVLKELARRQDVGEDVSGIIDDYNSIDPNDKYPLSLEVVGFEREFTENNLLLRERMKQKSEFLDGLLK